MKLTVALIALTLSAWQADAFVVGPRHGKTTTLSKRTSLFVQYKDDGSWKSDFLDRIPEASAPKKEAPKQKEPEPAAPKPGPIPSATSPIGISTDATPPAPAPAMTAPKPAPKAVAPAPTPSSSSSPDLPLPLIGGALAAFAAATFAMRGGKDGRETAQSGGGGSSGVDLSIPYDAAAKLAYDKSDKSMAYAKFKTNYEEEAVADVIAKMKGDSAPKEKVPAGVDISIPYHAAAHLAYEKSDKKMPYDKFQTKYEADAVADVKAKQKK